MRTKIKIKFNYDRFINNKNGIENKGNRYYHNNDSSSYKINDSKERIGNYKHSPIA